MAFGKILKIEKGFQIKLAEKVIDLYKDIYPILSSKQSEIITVIQKEEEKFDKTLEKGFKEFEVNLRDSINSGKKIDSKRVFELHSTYGFPLEITKEICEEKGVKLDEKECDRLIKKHKEISRAGAEKKFGGIGKNASYESTKLHTATHLLHASLRRVLGDHVRQEGSDINSERLRFDFSHPKKMTKEEIEEVENLVNKKIEEDLEVKKEEMGFKEAVNSGALAFFKDKYPDRVSVYSIGDFSKEVCAGPHVEKTSELGKFKIKKEKSSSAGIRRIKAILENN
jgi:alanyl-tRNA synthetase